MDIDEIAHYIGQNYGYDVDSSLKRMLNEEEITSIQKILWVDYGIRDCWIETFYCDTCKEYNPDTHFHMDVRFMLSEEQRNIVDKRLRECRKNDDANSRREAYQFYILFERVLWGLERNSNFILVKKTFYDEVINLKIDHINNFIKDNISRLDIVDDSEWEYKCEIFVGRPIDNYFLYEM